MTREQEMLMSALNVSVSSHLVDERFTCIWANEFYYKLIGYPKSKYEALFHNHADEYYSNNPEGWEALTKKVASVLEKGEDKYEMIVPMKFEDGTSYWVKLVSFFTDQYVNGYRTSYTVMTDVTELVQTKNELEMMMQAMKVSVSKHKVDEHFSLVWANEFYYQLIGYTKSEYEARFHDRCDEYFMDNLETWDILCNKIDSMSTACCSRAGMMSDINIKTVFHPYSLQKSFSRDTRRIFRQDKVFDPGGGQVQCLCGGIHF